MSFSKRAAVLGSIGLALLAGAAPAMASKPSGCRRCTSADTTAPAIAFSSPAAGSTVGATVTASGNASDNAAVSYVDVAVDGGGWQRTSGTSSWSAPIAGLSTGSHTLTAQATDTSGNTSATSVAVTVAGDTTAPSVAISSPAAGSTVSGTVTVSGSAADNSSLTAVDVQVDGGTWNRASGTASWTWGWSTTALANGTHTLTARATDSAGNATTASRSVNVSNSAPAPTPTPTSTAPNTQGSWVSPEGVTINVNSAGPWTINQIYSILKANAYQLDLVGPHLTINVQDTYASQTSASATSSGGTYTDYSATIYLKGVNSTFATAPDSQETHEYGHAWTRYHLYMTQQGQWGPYLNERWSSSDGSTTLATDSRTGTSYTWDPAEIIADDYRLLFGTSAAQANGDLNSYIIDPRQQPGLKNWFLTTFGA